MGRRTTSRVTALQRLDALLNATRIRACDVDAVIAAHPGARGLPRLRAVLPLVDAGAESPQETVARLALAALGWQIIRVSRSPIVISTTGQRRVAS